MDVDTPAMTRPSGAIAAFRGYLTIVVGAGATRALSLVTTIILARWLGRESFGEVSVFLAFLAFWSGSDFIDQTFVRYTSNDLGSTHRHLRAALALKIGLNLALIATAYPIAYLVARAAFDKPVLVPAILTALLCGVGLNFLSLAGATYQARERFIGFTAATSIFYGLAFAAVVCVVVLVGAPSTTPIYAAYLLAASVAGAWAFGRLKLLVGPLIIDGDGIRAMLGFSRWLLGANLTYLLFQRLDMFLLAALSPLATVGEYGAALRIVAIVSLLTGTIAPALLPSATRAGQSSDLLRPYLKRAVLLSATLAIPVAALWAAAPLAVTAAFGDSYRGAATIVRVFLVGTLLVAAYTPLAQLFLTEDRPRKMFYLGIVKLAAILGAGLVIIPRFDAVGAALTVAISEAAAFLYVLLAVRKLTSSLVVFPAKGTA